MTTSARLSKKVEASLTRFCRTHNVTKTQAISQALTILLEQSRDTERHPAFLAFQQLALVPEQPETGAKGRSSDAMRQAVRAKYHR